MTRNKNSNSKIIGYLDENTIERFNIEKWVQKK